MKSGSARTAAISSILFSVLLLSGVALAQGAYGSNVIQSKSNTVNVSSGSGSVDNTQSTGVSVSITGLAGVNSAVVTTQSLSGPSSGVSTFSSGGTYFDVSISLPAGTTAPAGATVTVCFTNPSVASSNTLYYWTGSWTAATNVSVTGTTICGTVPLSALTGTNFIAATPAADYTLYYIAAIVILVIIVVAFVAMRRGKKSP
ncbi:MAG: hypothetical protein JRN08_09855 [Nitrososphaerota archaeon]|nr:hypothetical protein [Nitrososphaerota archaeon]